MLPVLLDIQFLHLKIYTFGVFLVLAFFWGTFLLWRNIRLTSFKEEDIFDGLFISMIGGLFLSRLAYVAFHFSKFGFNIAKFILINGYPGLNLYGCLIGGFIAFLIFCHFKKIKFNDIIDYTISPLFIAIGIGKLGAFFSGVEVGTKTHFFIAFKYVNFDGFRHITAFYESIIFFVTAFVCHKILFNIRREKYWKGITFFFFCWLFSVVYFIFDPLKQYKTFLFGQSINWAVSLSLLLTFSLYFLYHLRSKFLRPIVRITSSIKKPHDKHTSRHLHSTTTEDITGPSKETSGTDRKT